MLSPKLRWMLLILGAVISFGIPVSTIWNQFRILNEGETLKIQLQPIDPYDPFRGRYVRLDFDLGNATWDKTQEVEKDHRVAKAYLSYEIDSNGFAKADTLYDKPPTDSPYLIVQNVQHNSYMDIWHFDLPFDRYYLNEKDAPIAEEIARDTLRTVGDRKEESYIVIRSLHGKAAIDSLYLGEERIEERIKQVRGERASRQKQ